MSKLTSHNKTNITGNQLETAIMTVLVNKGFELVAFKDWQNNPQNYGDELLLKNVPFTTIYGHQGKTEFLLKSVKYNKQIRIECKWQQVAGSVDEKLPYLYLNAVEKMPEKEIILLIDGPGWKPGAIDWIRNAVQNNQYSNVFNNGKEITVFNLSEFFAWANQEF